MIFKYLEKDTVYEVLISTLNPDDTINVKPFGLQVHDNKIILKLYPNHTLFNIKNKNKFTLHFTNNPLIFTRAYYGMLYDDYDDYADYSIDCEVISLTTNNIEDLIGKNKLTTITAKPIKHIKKQETIPIINRATNKIIELLVDYSRIKYQDIDALNKFNEKLEETSKYIQKNGNQKHKKALKIIKEKTEEVNPHD